MGKTEVSEILGEKGTTRDSLIKSVVPAVIFITVMFLIAAGCDLLRPSLTVTVSTNPVVGGIVEVRPQNEDLRAGDTVFLMATPNDGFVFSGWMSDGSLVSRQPMFVLSNLSDNVQLVANFDIESGVETEGEGWLIMVYMDGANNLEMDALIDLNDMEYGLSRTDPRTIKIVALIDRIGTADLPFEFRDYDDDSDGNWTGTRLYEVMPDAGDPPAGYDSGGRELRSKKLIGWESRESFEHEEDMGDVETLSSFISWALETYPKYPNTALVLWNHGAGMRSIAPEGGIVPREIGDDWEVDPVLAPDNDSVYPLERTLYLDEIQQALSTSFDGDNRLTVLGMDACLMGTVEVAYEFRDLTEYLVFSPAVEYGGWYWSKVIAGFSVDTTGEAFVTRVAQLYKEKAEELLIDSQGRLNAQTAVTTTGLNELKSSLDSLAVAIHTEYEDSRDVIHTLRDASLYYWEDDYESIFYPYYELGAVLSSLLKSEEISESVKSAASAVQQALSDVILYAWAGAGIGGYEGANISYGLSIFLSRGEKDHRRTWNSSESYSHYAFQWWYTAETTPHEQYQFYGNIDFADSDGDGVVETWREWMEVWYDPDDELTPGTW